MAAVPAFAAMVGGYNNDCYSPKDDAAIHRDGPPFEGSGFPLERSVVALPIGQIDDDLRPERAPMLSVRSAPWQIVWEGEFRTWRSRLISIPQATRSWRGNTMRR